MTPSSYRAHGDPDRPRAPRGQHRARPADPPTRLDPFPGRDVRPTDVPDDVDAATVYVPSTGELRRPREVVGPPPPPDLAEPEITYDGVAPLVVFVALVVALLVVVLVVVPALVT